MKILLFIKQAFLSVRTNKLRSFLSILWIIIWIMSFVIMLSIWEWFKVSIMKNFAWESNVIFVSEKNNHNNNNQKQSEKPSDNTQGNVKNILTKEISEQIIKKVSTVENAFLSYNYKSYWNITYNWKYIPWALMPVQQWYLKYKNARIAYWTNFSDQNFASWDNFVILWYDLVYSAFGNDNPVGKTIFIWWIPFIVWWILEKDSWYDLNYAIFVPDSTIEKHFWDLQVQSIRVIVKEKEYVEDTKSYLNFFLMKKSWVESITDVKFSLRTNEQILKSVNKSTQQFTLLLWWIWIIALVVWWIWIMNIMLVSVTERTREIWIRKSIWATNWNILMQFLIEAIIITFIGSALAIFLSYLLVHFVNEYWLLWNDVKPYIWTNTLMVAIIVSWFMWLVFWIMPAYKAAKLRPIDALRFE